MSDDPGPTIVHEMGPFAIVPLWLLDALVEAKQPEALKLYVALHRWTAGGDRSCHPSRQSIALSIGASMDTVDRYVKVLVKVGALSVQRRIDENGDWTSNRYVLHACGPTAQMRPGGRTDAATGGRVDAATGSRTDAAQTKPSVEPDPLEPDKNNSAVDFDDFWSAFLNAFGSKRAGSRGAASRAWGKLAKTQRAEAIQAVARHGQCLRSDPQGYAVPHASTWLNDCRFMDATLLERPSSTNGRANPFAERLRRSAALPPQGELS